MVSQTLVVAPAEGSMLFARRCGSAVEGTQTADSIDRRQHTTASTQQPANNSQQQVASRQHTVDSRQQN
jgi:hypothetical protein